jgi:ferrochelatase
MSSFRAEASWDRYLADVADARARTAGAPEVTFAPPWFDRPGFIAAVADRARVAREAVPPAERSAVPVVFTAHSIPVAMADASPYVHDYATAARAVAGRLGYERFTLAYQSRSGSPRDPWLEPDVNDVLRDLAAGGGVRDVVVVPIGFVCDHVEVLYDLDVEARAVAGGLGLRLHRAAAVNVHPRFIATLAGLVRPALADANGRPAAAPEARPAGPGRPDR